MSKRCPEHGSFEALVYSDAELYMAQMRFNKAGTIPHEFQTEIRDGCPLDCGLCPDHKQHTYLAQDGDPEAIMFSGGEPSIHPQIMEFMQMAKDRGISQIFLNTNGIRFARDRDFAEAVAELDLIVYRQFGGFDEATHIAI